MHGKRETKHLGVIFDDRLSFKTHIRIFLEELAVGMKTIRTMRKSLPWNWVKVNLNALVRNRFECSRLFSSNIFERCICALEKQLN